MLKMGEIDALIGPRPPSSYEGGKRNVKRLFEDFEREEVQYYKKNKIFPIMHIIVIRQGIYESYAWAAQNLYKAFCRAKEICFRNLAQTGFVDYSPPWLIRGLNKIRETLGEDFWPYGIEKNQKEIETLIQYSVEQGLINKRLKIEEIFAENTFSGLKV